MTAPGDFRAALVGMMPVLRRFARSFTTSRAHADDLMQETLLQALVHAGRFTAGTNLRAWLFSILRNRFLSGRRKARREVQDVDGALAAGLSVAPVQEEAVALREMEAALQTLPEHQREALMLVGADGLGYGEAAARSGCAPGTMKSRVSRGRARLLALLRPGRR